MNKCDFCPNSELPSCSGGFCSSAYEIMIDILGYDPNGVKCKNSIEEEEDDET